MTRFGSTPTTGQLTAVALVCTVKHAPAPSSSELMVRQLLAEFDGCGVFADTIRIVDFDIRPDVTAHDVDVWPGIRHALAAADIVLIATPTWLGPMSSVARRVLERLAAELSETEEGERPSLVGKVAIAAVVGNQDGARRIITDLYRGLEGLGCTVPALGGAYWNGDVAESAAIPSAVCAANRALVQDAVELAHSFPAYR